MSCQYNITIQYIGYYFTPKFIVYLHKMITANPRFAAWSPVVSVIVAIHLLLFSVTGTIFLVCKNIPQISCQIYLCFSCHSHWKPTLSLRRNHSYSGRRL